MFRFARSILRDSCDADDVTQDVYEKMWKGKGEIHKYQNPEAFLMTMTRNCCIDRIRKRRFDVEVEACNCTHNEHEAKVEGNDMIALVRTTIASLPEKQRAVMHLRDVEGYEVDEIAKVLDMESAAVRVNLSRGRSRVKELLIKQMNHGIR